MRSGHVSPSGRPVCCLSSYALAAPTPPAPLLGAGGACCFGGTQLKREHAATVAALEKRVRESADEAAQLRQANQAAQERLVATEGARAKLDARLAQVMVRQRALGKQHDEDAALYKALDASYRAVVNADVRAVWDEPRRRPSWLTGRHPMRVGVGGRPLQAAKARKIVDLEEQVHDLMFYLGTQKTVAASPHRDEIQEGQIVVPAASPPTPPAGTSRRGRR